MGFIQNCFIRKSTEDLTKKVYRIGGRSGRGYWHSDINTLLICESDQYRCLDDEWGNAVSLTQKGYIDCGTNEELFLAIAALRDDTDRYQWFVDDNFGNDWIKSDTAQLCDLWQGEPDTDDPFRTELENEGYQPFPYHKATVEELINHFK